LYKIPAGNILLVTFS